jgi:hypothetical protein
VKEIEFDASGAATHFWATFDQTCGGVLHGDVRFNADVLLHLYAPTHRSAQEGRLLSFDVHGIDVLGNPATYSVSGLPPGAAFTDAGDGSGHFAWTPAPGQAGQGGWMTIDAASPLDVGEIRTFVEAIPDFDDFDHAIPITTVPYTSVVYNPQATRSDDDPICPSPGPGTYPTPPPDPDLGTVWYAFTPAESGDYQVQVAPFFPPDTEPHLIAAGLSVFTGERGALEPLECSPFTAQRFMATAGETYHLKVDASPVSQIWVSAAALPPAPGNDEIAHATAVGPLPYSDAIDTRGALVQADEPGHCPPPPPGIGPGFGAAFPLPPINVWYAYTPTEDTRVTADTSASNYTAEITSFGGVPGALVPLACSYHRASFTALAGRPYYLMVAASPVSWGDKLQLSLTGMPPLHLQVALDSVGFVDPRTDQAVLRGTVTCSRPAKVVVKGTLLGRRLALGEFTANVTCTGTNAWSVSVAPNSAQSLSPRFKIGFAHATFQASGVPGDNPDDEADVAGQSAITLKHDLQRGSRDQPPVDARAESNR